MIKKKISSLLAVSAIICAAAVTTSANAEEVKSTDSNNQVAVQRVNNKKTRSVVAVGQVTANGGLNVRKSPNTNSKILKVLNTGEKVNIKWTEPGWYYIEHKGTEGYVSAKYVKKISSTSSSDGDVAYSATGTVSTSSKIGVNLRKGPSTSSAMIMGIPDGAKLTITAKNGSWYKVSYSGNVGYVHSDYVKVGGSSSSNGDVAYSATGTVSTSSDIGVNLRKGPSTSSAMIMGIPEGAKLTITAKNGSWYKVSYSGNVGYVHSDYVKVGGSSSSNGDVEYNATGVVNTSSNTGVNLRKGPSTSSAMIMGIPDGAKLTITAKNGNWYKVSYAGNIGYVHSDYVDIGGNSSSGESSNPSSTYQKILDIMKAQIGSPYVWGGTGEFITNDSINTLRKRFPDANRKGWYDKIPSSYYNNGYRAFDCSGLMQWSFRQAGVSIGRTTYDQVYDGYGVNVNSAKPGDLLIYSNKEHVGMYIGNGQWIESPYPGGYVRISNVPWSRIGYARRVL